MIALIYRTLDLNRFWNVILETGHITVAMFFLIISANIYSRMLTLSGITQFVVFWVKSSGIEFAGFLVIYIVLIVFLGTIMDASSIVMIVGPPSISISEVVWGQYDLVWGSNCAGG